MIGPLESPASPRPGLRQLWRDFGLTYAANGFVGAESVGEEMLGYYFEAGYDVLSVLVPDTGAALSPYVRYESVDTQVEVPAGFSSDPANDFDVMTIGLHFAPIPGIAIKLDYADYDGGGSDRLNFSVGYAF